MRHTLLATALTILLTLPALADEPVTPEESENIQIAIAAWGCQGGTAEKEPEVDHYEVDDAQCTSGEYDIKLDGAFKVILIHAH